MKIPNKAYEAFYDRGIVYYLPRRQTKTEQEWKQCVIPAWLNEIIRFQRMEAYRDGKLAAKTDIRDALGL